MTVKLIRVCKALRHGDNAQQRGCRKCKLRLKEICILKLCRIKPIDENAVDFAADFDNVWFFEEGIKNGGIARNFSDLLCCTQFCGDYHIKAINDKFVKQMSVSEALHELKLDDDGMVNTITKNLKEKN